ncbi:hypothetical protein FI667_g15259, partial [Globisporangium splendens]
MRLRLACWHSFSSITRVLNACLLRSSVRVLQVAVNACFLRGNSGGCGLRSFIAALLIAARSNGTLFIRFFYHAVSSVKRAIVSMDAAGSLTWLRAWLFLYSGQSDTMGTPAFANSPDRTRSMSSLHCAVVGQQTVFPVNIELNCTVHELKEKIITQNEFPFPARSLELYLAKKDGSWLKVEDLGELLKGGVDEICGGYTEMCPLLKLDLEYFGVDFVSSPESLHILVVPPERGIEVRNLELRMKRLSILECFIGVSLASALPPLPRQDATVHPSAFTRQITSLSTQLHVIASSSALNAIVPSPLSTKRTTQQLGQTSSPTSVYANASRVFWSGKLFLHAAIGIGYVVLAVLRQTLTHTLPLQVPLFVAHNDDAIVAECQLVVASCSLFASIHFGLMLAMPLQKTRCFGTRVRVTPVMVIAAASPASNDQVQPFESVHSNSAERNGLNSAPAPKAKPIAEHPRDHHQLLAASHCSYFDAKSKSIAATTLLIVPIGPLVHKPTHPMPELLNNEESKDQHTELAIDFNCDDLSRHERFEYQDSLGCALRDCELRLWRREDELLKFLLCTERVARTGTTILREPSESWIERSTMDREHRNGSTCCANAVVDVWRWRSVRESERATIAGRDAVVTQSRTRSRMESSPCCM